jgi:Arc/MetJ family transcription regulator
LRTNIVIDEKLMKETLRLTGLKTMREAVELGLRTIVRLRKQEAIRRFRRKLPWQGDLDGEFPAFSCENNARHKFLPAALPGNMQR